MRLFSKRGVRAAPAILLTIGAVLLLLPGAGLAAKPGGTPVKCNTNDLIKAITKANKKADLDTLSLKAKCTYTLTAGPYSNGDGPNGLPIITAPLTIQGKGATIVRDPTAPVFRILQTQGFSAQDALSLDNVTLRGGSADNGGAVLMRGGTLTITGSTLTDNFAIRRGGAIFAEGPWDESSALTVPVTVTLGGSTFARNTVHAPPCNEPCVRGGGAVWAIGGGTLTVRGSTFTENSAQVDEDAAPYGGALAANTAVVTIEHTTFASNSAPPDGGGGAVYSGGSFSVSDCTFTDNANAAIFWEGYEEVTPTTLAVTNSTFDRNAGGAITGFRGPFSTLRVTDSVFTGNTSSWGGGAIGAMGVTIVTGSDFTGNSAPSGGAITAIAAYDYDALSLTVTDSTFTGNRSTNPSNVWFLGGGGAINVGGGDPALGGVSTVRLERDLFEGNSAGGLGGAVSIGADSVAVVGSTFTSNRAGDDAGPGSHGNASNGGAIFSESRAMSITDSTFTRNAASLGGAVDWEYGGQDPHALTVTGSTFSGNDGSQVDGLAVMMCAYGQNTDCSDVVTVANSTFDQDGIWGSRGTLHVTNATLSGGQLAIGGGSYMTTTTLANTILAGVTCTGSVLDGGGNLSFNSTGCPGIPGDPKLGPLVDNDGPTWTMALDPGSAAIGTAIGSICVAPVGPPSYGAGGIDQRGVTRPQGSGCDIGAYEQQVIP